MVQQVRVSLQVLIALPWSDIAGFWRMMRHTKCRMVGERSGEIRHSAGRTGRSEGS